MLQTPAVDRLTEGTAPRIRGHVRPCETRLRQDLVTAGDAPFQMVVDQRSTGPQNQNPEDGCCLVPEGERPPATPGLESISLKNCPFGIACEFSQVEST